MMKKTVCALILVGIAAALVFSAAGVMAAPDGRAMPEGEHPGRMNPEMLQMQRQNAEKTQAQIERIATALEKIAGEMAASNRMAQETLGVAEPTTM